MKINVQEICGISTNAKMFVCCKLLMKKTRPQKVSNKLLFTQSDALFLINHRLNAINDLQIPTQRYST